MLQRRACKYRQVDTNELIKFGEDTLATLAQLRHSPSPPPPPARFRKFFFLGGGGEASAMTMISNNNNGTNLKNKRTWLLLWISR
ncbi:hypothetical protein HanRHA438_Chr03g0135031 [Helianthus annuus]|nr:hypothetical protein HanRHA438_Chr03g0135031 [Helianthus annuus]